jgi:hypothetical protein
MTATAGPLSGPEEGLGETMKTNVMTTTWLLLLGGAVLLGAGSAAAQGSPAPGANQAFLYELDEDAVLLNAAGHVLVPDPAATSPTGLVDATNGAVGIPAVRQATSQLQGVAALGSLLCPIPQEVTVGASDCTVIATGTDHVQLVIDPATGSVLPSSGDVSGTYAVVVQLDNSADSPEMPVQTGTFSGVITFQPPLPLGIVSGGTLTIDGVPGTFPFNAVFRQPFRQNERAGVVTQRGRNVRAAKADSTSRVDAAYYLLDNGDLQEVRPDERAVGWPTVRFEITF